MTLYTVWCEVLNPPPPPYKVPFEASIRNSSLNFWGGPRRDENASGRKAPRFFPPPFDSRSPSQRITPLRVPVASKPSSRTTIAPLQQHSTERNRMCLPMAIAWLSRDWAFGASSTNFRILVGPNHHPPIMVLEANVPSLRHWLRIALKCIFLREILLQCNLCIYSTCCPQ